MAERAVRRHSEPGRSPAEPDATHPAPAAAGNAAMARLLESDPGRPIPAAVRGELESGLATPLDQVRVHTGPGAAEAASSVAARAFTVGSDIYFGRGEYAPGSTESYRLLAHEVAHTVQQGGAPGAPAASPVEVGEPASQAERQADAVADDLVAARGGATVPPQLLRQLHGSAGNAATSRLIARQPAPAPPAPPAGPTLAELDEALNHSDVDEDHVIDLLGRLAPADKARVLTGAYLTPLADAFNTGEMVRAVRNLAMPLWQALEWVEQAAGGWKSIDYPDIAGLIGAAPQAQRDVLKTTPWRDRFVRICDNDTMYTAVNDLAFDPRTKFDWMLEEGTDFNALAAVVRRTPAADLPPVVADAALMGRLREDLSGDDFATMDKMLRSGLLAEGDVEREYVGNEYHVWTALYRTGLHLTSTVKYLDPDGMGAAKMAAYKTAVQTGVARHMSGKWKLRIASIGARQEGDGDYPITFHVREGDGYEVTVHAGNGRDTTGEDGADWYENYLVGFNPDMIIAVHAHELGHLMLGAPEEYPPAPGDKHDLGRTITHDDSVMGSITPANATNLEVKDRALTFLTSWAATYFPGRRVTIIR